MKKKQEARLRAAIGQVLLHDWDPIGIRLNPLAPDEYHSYISGVFRLLTGDASEQKIADHLRQLERVGMGLSSANEARAMEAARRLKNIILETEADMV